MFFVEELVLEVVIEMLTGLSFKKKRMLCFLYRCLIIKFKSSANTRDDTVSTGGNNSFSSYRTFQGFISCCLQLHCICISRTNVFLKDYLYLCIDLILRKVHDSVGATFLPKNC